MVRLCESSFEKTASKQSAKQVFLKRLLNESSFLKTARKYYYKLKVNKLIAVYGTLRKGERNHQVLGDSEYLKTIRLKGFKMYGAPTFPAVIKGTTDDSIVIEIYRIKRQNISQALDFLEGFDRNNPSSAKNNYIIQLIKIDSEMEPVEIYTFGHHPEKVHQIGREIKSGDWCKRHQP